MEELVDILKNTIEEGFLFFVFSGPKQKEIQKIKVRPLSLKEGMVYQAAIHKGTQEFHQNLTGKELMDRTAQWIKGDFKQLQMELGDRTVTVLSGKKGNLTIKQKAHGGLTLSPQMGHNRKKQYIIEEGTPVPFLIDLGVMTKEGMVVKSRYDKFRQINRFLEFVRDVLPQLPRDREVTILDFGCGKSYLTFAVYYYLKVLQNLDIRIVGLDLKKDVIEKCNGLAEKYKYEKLNFLTGDIADYEGMERVDMVVTLHACDTATDYALGKAVSWGAKVILSVPCCQHELNGQIENPDQGPLLKYGLIKERMAALMTDAFRASLLEEAGYQVQVLEFIDMEHTPKNILIRAVYKGRKKQDKGLRECMEYWGADSTLARLLDIKGENKDGKKSR